MYADHQDLVRRFWHESFSGGNLGVIDELFSPDCVLRDLATKMTYDRAGLKRLIEDVRAEIPEAEAVIDRQLTASNQIVTQLRFRAPRPVYEPQQGSNEDWAEFHAISISEIADGKIARSTLLWEEMRAEQELRPPGFHPDLEWRWPPWR